MKANSLPSESIETCCNYLLNREIAHVLTSVGEKNIICMNECNTLIG